MGAVFVLARQKQEGIGVFDGMGEKEKQLLFLFFWNGCLL
jgi:ABC-type lipoprotein release transport system permease subunit